MNKTTHYDALATSRDKFRSWHKYYYDQIEKQYSFYIPKGKKVLEVGCSTGALLASLKPSYGVGIDISERTLEIARKEFPQYKFLHGSIDVLPKGEKFDFIVLSGLMGELDDIQDFLFKLREFCHRDTRIVIEYYSLLWQYALGVSEKLGLKMSDGVLNWLTAKDIENFLTLTGFQSVKSNRIVLLPVRATMRSRLLAGGGAGRKKNH